jgi:hypothetical protein
MTFLFIPQKNNKSKEMFFTMYLEKRTSKHQSNLILRKYYIVKKHFDIENLYIKMKKKTTV